MTLRTTADAGHNTTTPTACVQLQLDTPIEGESWILWAEHPSEGVGPITSVYPLCICLQAELEQKARQTMKCWSDGINE